jgi:hypothetical protein
MVQIKKAKKGRKARASKMKEYKQKIWRKKSETERKGE